MRVLIVDDHPSVVDGVSKLLSAEFDVVGTASDGAAMIAAASRLHPDVIVTDIVMPGISGIEASRKVLKGRPDVPIIVLTMHRDSRLVRSAFDAGVRAYVHKLRAGEELIAAIHCVLQGSTFVSPNCGPGALPTA